MERFSVISLLALLTLSSAVFAEKPQKGGTAPAPKCKIVKIPAIVCPAGWDLAKDLEAQSNKCKTQLIDRTVCKNAAAYTGNQKEVEVITAPATN
jgi:hypothetical protein